LLVAILDKVKLSTPSKKYKQARWVLKDRILKWSMYLKEEQVRYKEKVVE